MMPEVSDKPVSCDRCGKESLGKLGDENLCEDCLHEASACCADTLD